MRFLTILFLLIALNTTAQDELIVNGEVWGLGNDKAVLLKDGKEISKEFLVENDVFKFSKENIKPGSYAIYFKNNDTYLPIILENGNLNVFASVYKKEGRYLKETIVKGSKINDEIRKLDYLFDDFVATFPKQDQEDYFEYVYLFRDRQNLTRAERVENRFMKKYPNLEKDYCYFLYQFLKSHAKDLSIIYNLPKISHKLTQDQVMDIVKLIPKQYFEYPLLKKFNKLLVAKKNSSVGAKAYDFTLKDFNGKSVSLSHFRGKYILLDFWATWCGPCCKAMPHLKQIQDKYKAKGLQVISISADMDHKKWRKVSPKFQMTWPNLINKGKNELGNIDIIEKFQVKALPTIFILDKEGKIISRILGADKIDTELKKIFKF